MKGGYAWVTLATNDSYSLGALVLANSLKQVGTQHQLAVLITPGVTNAMRSKLEEVFNVVKEVNVLDSKDEANLKLLKRPELGITFTKLHCWRLTQYEKCVFLDADTLVLENCDELFEREELSAAPDIGWPDCFNSGVFVYRPSNETYDKIIQFALDKGSFDGGDQGLLNLYFSDWASKDISKHLPFIYNMASTACYSYFPAFKQFGKDAKIIHFLGSSKPWLQYFNTETRKVHPSQGLNHLEGILQMWWNIFCEMIHPKLSPDMAGLAGAFANLTLGQPRTAEQQALDDHLRRQGWEVGNIDYLGRDAFDNIWNKICETLSSEQSITKSEEKPVESAPEIKEDSQEKVKQVQNILSTEPVISALEQMKQPEPLISQKEQVTPTQVTSPCELQSAPAEEVLKEDVQKLTSSFEPSVVPVTDKSTEAEPISQPEVTIQPKTSASLTGQPKISESSVGQIVSEAPKTTPVDNTKETLDTPKPEQISTETLKEISPEIKPTDVAKVETKVESLTKEDKEVSQVPSDESKQTSQVKMDCKDLEISKEVKDTTEVSTVISNEPPKNIPLESKEMSQVIAEKPKEDVPIEKLREDSQKSTEKPIIVSEKSIESTEKKESEIPTEEPKQDSQISTEKSKEVSQITAEKPKEVTQTPKEKPKDDTQIPTEKPKNDSQILTEKPKEISQIPTEKPKEDSRIAIEKPKEDSRIAIEKPKEISEETTQKSTDSSKIPDEKPKTSADSSKPISEKSKTAETEKTEHTKVSSSDTIKTPTTETTQAVKQGSPETAPSAVVTQPTPPLTPSSPPVEVASNKSLQIDTTVPDTPPVSTAPVPASSDSATSPTPPPRKAAGAPKKSGGKKK